MSERAPSLVTEIRYMAQPAVVACDAQCRKAWGINGRPRVQLSEDVDDYALRADGELGEAPADPGTYEGGHAKPAAVPELHNKWCVRECERSVMAKPGEPLVLPDFSRRLTNRPATHEAPRG